MLAVVGTVPENDFPLLAGEVTLEDGYICIQGRKAPVNRGTPALIAAAAKTGVALGQPKLFGYLVGDIGRGDGSKKLYQYLAEHLNQTNFHTIAFHYLQPLVEWHGRILAAVRQMTPRPILIADAGFMYMAKMSGESSAYDLFTPDVGEIAFLADEVAPHPFYTRGFILHEQNQVPELIARAYAHGNAPEFLLVKGSKDYLANREGIQDIIDAPSEESMEAIGGTGDTLTGIAAALSASRLNIREAAAVAARVNRLAGSYSKPTPATQVMDIIERIPEALEFCLAKDPILEKCYERKQLMNSSMLDKKNAIHPGMTVLDVVSKYKRALDVFKKYDKQAGECICCQALFDSLQHVAEKYGLDLEKLLADLKEVETEVL